MLIVLDTTTRKLQANLSSGNSTDVTVIVTYADTTTTTFVEGVDPTALNGINVTDVLSAPVANTRRVVKSIMLYNADVSTQTVNLYLYDNGGSYPFATVTLPAGASWASDDQTGVNVGGAVTDGSKGDINVSSGGATWTIADDVVTLAKPAEMASDKLIGRDTASTGNPEYIGVTGGIEFDGAGNIRTTSFSGDVSKAAGGTVLTLTDASVTTAKLADTAVTTTKLADASVTPAKLSTTAQALSFRNFLINGDMGIRQRETSVTGIGSSGYYTVDRWNTLIAGTVGTWTQTSENDGPSGQGFPRSLKMTCTTSNASLGSTDQLVIQQRLEGQNVQGILKGTANAQQVTVSFWVKSGTTGTYIAELQDNDNSRYASKTYTINSANTWERKTLTFPADTSGVLDNDNGYSLSINFWLVAGSDFTSGSLQSGWQTTTANRAASSPAPVNLSAGQVAGTNYWQITGVQLELGTTATEFERLSITTATLLCQRYFFKLTQDNAGQFTWAFGAVSSADALYLILYPVAMRATPTLTMTGKITLYDGSANITETSANLSSYLGASRGRVQFPKGLLTAGRATWFDAVDVSPSNTIATTFAFAIEL